MRDLKSNIDVAQSIAPAARTTGTTTGAAVDLQNKDSAVIEYTTGAWTDGTHTPSVQESTDGTSFTDVGTADLQGTFTAVSGTAGQNGVQRVGYVGTKRYVRGMEVHGTSTTGVISGVNVIRGDPRLGPLA